MSRVDLLNEDGTATCIYDPKENEWVIKLEPAS